MKVRLVAVPLVVCLLSCGRDRGAAPSAEQAALGGDVAARVGADAIPLSLVVKVAAAQHVAPREALRRLVDDAVAADAARSRGLDRDMRVSWRLTAARGRLTADRILADARQAGPPTDAEIAQLTALYWREVDRPPAIRVIHAVVQRPKAPDAGAGAEDRARAMAEELRLAVLSAKSADEFEQAARALPHPGLDVVVEKLGAFAEDGKMTEYDGGFDSAFARGAWGIGAVGETSPVVESSFGWHVIRLVERVPEQRMPIAARRIAFADEVIATRARAASRARVEARKAATRVEIAPSAESLTRSLLATSKPGSSP